jgi:uncharacterized protein involved in exopolysaccharide biosynthesis
LVWWSWLLALVTIGGVVGGYKYGEVKWEEAPKDYLAIAKVSVRIRPPFVSKKAGIELATGAMANANEQEVLRRIESEEVLGAVVKSLELTDQWNVGSAGAVNKIRAGLLLELDKETNTLEVQVTLNDPQEAADVANTLGSLVPATVKEVDLNKKEAASELLETEARPLEDAESDARAKLTKALEANGINIKLTPQVDLGPYQELEDVLAAKVEWDSAREDLEDLKKEQFEYQQYWMRQLRPTIVSVKAEVPPTWSGPPVKPFQIRWATYGLTAGMMLGSLLMLLCWKLFP